jgi:hypothetical protein
MQAARQGRSCLVARLKHGSYRAELDMPSIRALREVIARLEAITLQLGSERPLLESGRRG